ncbi:ATP-dependent RNA helicase rhlE [Raoultella terrigena]|uniref:ATP-dependent RNA helicase rhlE n=1 Tax=Raoultella terrigena TaxID=577 RepID=A0A4U9DGF5_RAOTE|nr:ATP-dependent RNA helicase rhlE [Raoultella terrigena]
MSFDSLGLNPEILRAVAEQGYVEPTPIQQQAIPAVLQGRDLMASAQNRHRQNGGLYPAAASASDPARAAREGPSPGARADPHPYA